MVFNYGISTSPTYSGVISGTGTLTKSGPGTLTLTGGNNNTYTGTTTVNGGTLILNSTQQYTNLVPGDLVVNNGGTVTVSAGAGGINDCVYGFEHNVTVNAGGILNNSSSWQDLYSLTVTGTVLGTGWIAFGADGYPAATDSVLIGDGGCINGPENGTGPEIDLCTANPAQGIRCDGTTTGGTIASNIMIQGSSKTFTVDNAGAPLTISGVIFQYGGSYGITKTGTGTLTFTGNNSYTGTTTVSAGTLQLGDGTTNGTIAGNITDNAALVFNYGTSTSPTYSGVISGTGTLTKTGTGTLTFTGNNSYTGTTTVAPARCNWATGPPTAPSLETSPITPPWSSITALPQVRRTAA